MRDDCDLYDVMARDGATELRRWRRFVFQFFCDCEDHGVNAAIFAAIRRASFLGEPLGRRSLAVLLLEIDIRKRLAAVVADGEARGLLKRRGGQRGLN